MHIIPCIYLNRFVAVIFCALSISFCFFVFFAQLQAASVNPKNK